MLLVTQNFFTPPKFKHVKKKILASTFVMILIIAVHGQKLLFPVIKHYGGIADIPKAIDKPDSTLEYKIIVEAGSKIAHPDSIYEPFESVCRMYNLHIYGGVKPQNLHIELVVFSEPISVILNNEMYKKKFGVDNPNLQIIEEMKKAGIKLYACGQSVNAYGIDLASIVSNFEVVYSRLTTVSTRQLRGYAYFRF